MVAAHVRNALGIGVTSDPIGEKGAHDPITDGKQMCIRTAGLNHADTLRNRNSPPWESHL